MSFTTSPISALDCPNRDTDSLACTAIPTADCATSAASVALPAISRIEAPICSEPAETVAMLRDTSSAPEATRTAPELVCSALSAIWAVTADDSVAASANVWLFAFSCPTVTRRPAVAASSP
ncbi:hypothetical protein ACWKSP_00505 [Micromonosporaceae bacterium Da 78-11]